MFFCELHSLLWVLVTYAWQGSVVLLVAAHDGLLFFLGSFFLWWYGLVHQVLWLLWSVAFQWLWGQCFLKACYWVCGVLGGLLGLLATAGGALAALGAWLCLDLVGSHIF